MSQVQVFNGILYERLKQSMTGKYFHDKIGEMFKVLEVIQGDENNIYLYTEYPLVGANKIIFLGKFNKCFPASDKDIKNLKNFTLSLEKRLNSYARQSTDNIIN